MDSRKTLSSLHWTVCTIWRAISTCFGSFVILASCVVVFLWSQGMSPSTFSTEDEYLAGDAAVILEFALKLSFVIGVASFLANYVFDSSVWANAATCFGLCSIPVLSQLVVVVLIAIPAVLGGILGYYLNRYIRFRNAQTERTSIASSSSIRLSVLAICALVTFALAAPELRLWYIALAWMLKMSAMLSGAAATILKRAEIQIA